MIKRIFLGIALVVSFVVNANRIATIDLEGVAHEIEAMACVFGLEVDGDVLYEFIPTGTEAEHCWINRDDWIHFYAQPEAWRKQAAWIETARDFGGREVSTVNVYQQTGVVGTYRLQKTIDATHRADREALLPPVARRLPEETLTAADAEEALHSGHAGLGSDVEAPAASLAPTEIFGAVPAHTAESLERRLVLERRLREAAYIDDSTTIEETLAAGADVNAQDEDGYTALMHAASRGNLAVVKYLVERRNAAIDKRSRQPAYTALMLAALFGHLPVVQYLVEHGARVNMRSEIGTTALMLAARRNFLPVVRYLLSNGARANVRNEEGRNALDVARDPAIQELLRNAMGAQVDDREEGGVQLFSLADLLRGHEEE